MCFVFSIKLSFGYLNLDLNFKVIDLKWFNFKFLNIKYISKILWVKFISNSMILEFKIFSGFIKSKSLILFKLFKQSIWILITQIQIYVSISCHPNIFAFIQIVWILKKKLYNSNKIMIIFRRNDILYIN